MNREEKAELLSEMNGLISGSEAVVISHYRGLTVAEMGELRKKARELGAELRVTKNRITRLALKGTKFEGLDDLFKGPTIMAYSSDPISACKLCVQFAKENEKFLVVGFEFRRSVDGRNRTARNHSVYGRTARQDYRPAAGSGCRAGTRYQSLQRERSRVSLTSVAGIGRAFLTGLRIFCLN